MRMESPGICRPGDTCCWSKSIDDEGLLGCSPCGGPGSCERATLLSAKESSFHDRPLVQATNEIKGILERIERREGYTLSFLTTRMGILLAWVRDGAGDPKTGVTAMDDDRAVAEALGLIDWEGDAEQTSVQ